MFQTRCRTSTVVLAVMVILGIAPGLALGAPITLVPNTTNMFRDFRGVNNVGVGAGDVVQYGADIQGGSLPSSISALHVSGFVDPGAPCGPLIVNPNFCAGAFGFNSTRLTDWTIRFTNGPDSLNVAAPSLVGANPVPFPASVTITAGATATTPIISWVIPAGFVPEAFRVNIFDVDGPTRANGAKDIIHSAAIPASSVSYTIPATLSAGGSLQAGHNYSINFQVIDLRSGATEAQFVSTNNNALILSRSNSYFNFQPIASGTVPNVHLPQVGVDPNPFDNRGAPYQFSITSVGPNSVTFIDPFVAVGYDYAIGPGDPNFASVLLPNVGDGIFDVVFSNTHHAVLAGQQFFFPVGGVAAFSVGDIEVAAGLDPLNVTAFITGLTFVSDGSFTGTMTPIVQFVSGAAVPAPAGFELLIVGLAVLVVLGWQRSPK